MVTLIATLLISTQADALAQSAPSAARPPLRILTPVLTQGTLLSSVHGYIWPSESLPGLMQFTLEESTIGRARRTLTLLPCDPSDEVERMLAKRTPDTPWRFEVSGQVYEFAGRAYLLPASIVALKNPPPPPYLAREAPAELALLEPAAPSRAPMLDAYLEETLAPTPAPGADAAPLEHERQLPLVSRSNDDFAAELERRLAAGVRTSAAAKPVDEEIDRSMILDSGVRLQDSRATVTRDPLTGAWRAAIESATKPGALLSMEILPCRALERVERTQKTSPIGTPWLLSGEIVASGERNFLLLSSARPMPHDHWMWP